MNPDSTAYVVLVLLGTLGALGVTVLLTILLYGRKDNQS